jgi:glycerate kinase
MRVLVVAEAVDPDWSAAAVGAQVSSGWRRLHPEHDVAVVPWAQADRGFVPVARQAFAGSSAPGAGGTPAVLAAQDLLGSGAAASDVVATAVLRAMGQGAGRVVVALDGVEVADHGLGLLTAAGAVADGEGWVVPEAVGTLVAVTDDARRLVGPNGLAFRPSRRAGPRLDPATLERDAHLAAQAAQVRTRHDPTAGSRLAQQPGAGAGGGLGWAMLLLGARLVGSASVLAEAWDLPRRVAAADLVVAVTPTLDPVRFDRTGVAAAARAAAMAAVACVAVARHVDMGARELRALGVQAAYQVPDPRGGGAYDDEPLHQVGSRLASTWGRDR